MRRFLKSRGIYTMPAMPLLYNAWHAQNNPPVGAPDVSGAPGQLRPGGWTSALELGAETQTLQLLLVPPRTDLRGQLASSGPDTLELPAGSGSYWEVLAADDLYRGTPREARLALINPLPHASGPLTLIVDAMAGPTPLLMPAHTIAPINTPMTVWGTTQTGIWTLLSPANCQVTTSSGQNHIWCDPGAADVTVGLEFTMGAPYGYTGPVLNGLDPANYWVLDHAVGVSYLAYFVGGVLTVAGTYSNTITPGSTHMTTISSAGDTVTAVLDGTTLGIVTIPSRPLKANHQAGIYSGSLTGTSAGFFSVTSP